MPTEPSFWNVMKRGSGLQQVKITVTLTAEINYKKREGMRISHYFSKTNTVIVYVFLVPGHFVDTLPLLL
jgi:hypothetical protein